MNISEIITTLFKYRRETVSNIFDVTPWGLEVVKHDSGYFVPLSYEYVKTFADLSDLTIWLSLDTTNFDKFAFLFRVLHLQHGVYIGTKCGDDFTLFVCYHVVNEADAKSMCKDGGVNFMFNCSTKTYINL
jgi:hypothetical protein